MPPQISDDAADIIVWMAVGVAVWLVLFHLVLIVTDSYTHVW